jgi:hypothetical protein
LVARSGRTTRFQPTARGPWVWAVPTRTMARV